jgi:hypothetical protein
VFKVLEGKNVNLRVAEKEDSPLLAEWFSSLQVFGEYNPIWQVSKSEAEKIHESPNEPKMFIVEKKDGSKIGYILHFNVLHTVGKLLEIGYGLVPTERGKGYCTEDAQIMHACIASLLIRPRKIVFNKNCKTIKIQAFHKPNSNSGISDMMIFPYQLSSILYLECEHTRAHKL